MTDSYTEALLAHLESGDEVGLEAAYAIGRRTLESKKSVLDLASEHHDALAKLADLDADAIERAGAFLTEALSAFEMTYRGFFEASRMADLADAAAALNAAVTIADVESVADRWSPHLPGIELLDQMVAVAREKARLFEREQLIAETLQRSLLTDRLQSLPGVRLAARYLPGGDGSDVGGDWYDTMLVPGGLALTVGDVTGKGIHAAALMGQLRTALRAYALEGHGPADVVSALDRLLAGLGDTRMATTVYGVLEPTGQHLTFARAGHLPPLLVSTAGTAEYLEGGLSLPLGVDPARARTAARTTIPPGSTLLLYTDGLVEQRTRPLDVGLERLRTAAASAPHDVERFCDAVLDEMLPGGEPDDVAVLAVQVGDRG
jgi:serine phosphatase RsbU (regulator of sigma subunit)